MKRILGGITFLVSTLPLWSKNELSIDEFIQEAMANRKLGIVFKSKKEAIEALGREKLREFFPKVSLNYFGIQNLGENQPDNRYQDMRLQVQQLVWDGGVLDKQRQLAKVAEEVFRADSKKEEQNLELDWKRSIYRIQILETKNRLLEERRSREAFQFVKIERDWKAGFISKIEYLKYAAKEGENEELQNNLNFERERIISYLLDSCFWTESYPSLKENIIRDLVLIPPRQISETYWDEAYLDSLEGKKLRLSIEKSFIEDKLADTDWSPKIHVGAYVGKNYFEGKEVLQNTAGWNVQISLPFFGNQFQAQNLTGFQPDGGGYQRIPGFGTNQVGPGTNSFQSGQLGLLDGLHQETHKKEIFAKNLELRIQLEAKRKFAISEMKNLSRRLFLLYPQILQKEIRATAFYEEWLFGKEKQNGRDSIASNLLRKQWEDIFFSLLDDFATYLELSDRYYSILGEECLTKWDRGKGNLHHWQFLLSKGGSK